MRFGLSSKFLRNFRKLPREIIDLTKERLELFYVDPWQGSLKTHKLSGDRKDHWAFSINYEYRVVFRQQDNEILLVDVGLHDDVY